LVSRNIFGFLMISLTLLLGLLLSPIYAGENGQTDRAVTTKNPVEFVDVINKTEKLHRIIVYYFHRTVRCETCIEIENLTLETVEEAFEKELSTGTIEIKVINMEEDVNSHFTKEYKLNVQSVIISDMAVSNEIRWKNLDKIWDYVSDKQEFKEYIIDEVRAYL
jgi:hypothetical protein